MTTIQDRIETLKNIFFANGVKCDSEQFLIEDINNLIKEVEEETRKETIDNLKKIPKDKIMETSTFGYDFDRQAFEKWFNNYINNL